MEHFFKIRQSLNLDFIVCENQWLSHPNAGRAGIRRSAQSATIAEEVNSLLLLRTRTRERLQDRGGSASVQYHRDQDGITIVGNKQPDEIAVVDISV